MILDAIKEIAKMLYVAGELLATIDDVNLKSPNHTKHINRVA